MRRRLSTALATAALLLGGMPPAVAAPQASMTDPAGDLAPEGEPALLTGPQARAIDVVGADAAMGTGRLAVSLRVDGTLSERRVDEESGTVIFLWQGDGSDPSGQWVFALFDGGRQYFALYDDPASEFGWGFSESCAAWTASETGAVASYEIEFACLPGADTTAPLKWGVTAGTGNGSNSWSDVAPDMDPSVELVSGPTLTFPPGSTTARPTPVARETADTCDGREAQTNFGDVEGNAHEAAIRCISHYGITQGTGGNDYSPAAPLSQGQTATFLVRTLEVAGLDLAAPGDACDDDGVHAENLERLIAAKVIVAPTDRDCGEINAVSRAVMARWVLAALARGGVTTDSVTDWYGDDDGHPDEGAINDISAIGVVTGRGGATFVPEATLSRAQMATFLSRTLDALFDAAEAAA